MLGRHPYFGPGNRPGERRYLTPTGSMQTYRWADGPALFLSADLRWWIEPAGSPLGLQISQVDEDGRTRLYTRCLASVWAMALERYPLARLAEIRMALIQLHGADLVASAEPPHIRRPSAA